MFWESQAVIAPTDGKKYHSYGCQHMGDGPFHIYDPKTAKSSGYSPCPHCDPPNPTGQLVRTSED